jgi:hypothetical protein
MSAPGSVSGPSATPGPRNGAPTVARSEDATVIALISELTSA